MTTRVYSSSTINKKGQRIYFKDKVARELIDEIISGGGGCNYVIADIETCRSIVDELLDTALWYNG